MGCKDAVYSIGLMAYAYRLMALAFRLMARGLLRTFGCGGVFFVHQTAAAGAWPLAPGDGQVISTTLYDNARTGYGDNWRLSQDVQFNKYEASVYLEHGITEKLTLIVNTSLQEIQLKAGVDDIDFSGVGESYVGLRRVVWQDDKWIASAQGGVIFAGSGEAFSNADLGGGKTHYEARALLGRSFKAFKRDGFIDLEAAYRYRPSDRPDDWRIDATVGWSIFKKLELQSQIFYTNSQAQFEVTPRNIRVKAQDSLVYRHSKKTSYQIGINHTIAGRNVYNERAFFIAIWKRY